MREDDVGMRQSILAFFVSIVTSVVSSATTIGHVVPSKPAYDNAGKEIGFVNSEGQLVVKGNRIGFVPLEDDEVVDDPGKKRVLTPGPAGGCVIPERNPLNQRMLEPGESIPVCGKTVEEVMGSIQVMFGSACKAGVEQILYVVKLPDDRYELRRGDTGDGTPTNVRFRPRLARGETIVGIVTGRLSQTFEYFPAAYCSYCAASCGSCPSQ